MHKLILIAIIILNTAWGSTHPLSVYERKIEVIIKQVLSMYCSFSYDVTVNNSEKAIEYQINFHPADKDVIVGYGGIRLRNLRTLVNEMHIQGERQRMRNIGEKFDLVKRKLVFVRYIVDQTK